MMQDPVAAAEHIMRTSALGSAPEIDWSQDPVDDRERKLRAAVLRVIERKHTGAGRSLLGWQWDLERLASVSVFCTDAEMERLGLDLRAEIKRVRAIVETERADRGRRELEETVREAANEVRHEARFNELASELAEREPNMPFTLAVKSIRDQMAAEGFK